MRVWLFMENSISDRLLTIHCDVDVVEADVGSETSLHAVRRERAVEGVDLHRARLPVRAGGANCRQEKEAVVQIDS